MTFHRIFDDFFCVVMSMVMLMLVDEFLGFFGFSMKFDEDVLKMMKKRKGRKKMKFYINFWVWSHYEFCFLILVPRTL
jgi:hypothetical protein